MSLLSRPTLIALFALAGLIAWIAAHALLASSREPVAPLALLVGGFALLLPLLRHQRALPPNPGAPPAAEGIVLIRGSRVVFGVAALAAGLVAVLLVRTYEVTPLLVLAWVWALAAALCVALVDLPLPGPRALGQGLLTCLPDLALANAAMLPALILLLLTPLPQTPLPAHLRHLNGVGYLHTSPPLINLIDADTSPLYLYIAAALLPEPPDLRSLVLLSGLAVLLLPPLVYAAGRVAGLERLAAVGAAVLAGVCGWTLALAKSGSPFAAAVLCASLSLAALLTALRTGSRLAFVAAALALGLGVAISPALFPQTLLLPLAALLVWWRERGQARLAELRGVLHPLLAGPLFGLELLVGWIVQRRLPGALASTGVLLALIAPVIAVAPDKFLFRSDPTFAVQVGVPQSYAAAESLAQGLLLLNVARDDSPVHLLVHRPVLAVIPAALFLLGVLALIWRLFYVSESRGCDGLLLAALLVGLLPSVLTLDLPLHTPHLGRAAGALPAALGIVGQGIALLAVALRRAFGRLGVGLAAVLLVAALLLTAWDSAQHYTLIALPAYEAAAPHYHTANRLGW